MTDSMRNLIEAFSLQSPSASLWGGFQAALKPYTTTVQPTQRKIGPYVVNFYEENGYTLISLATVESQAVLPFKVQAAWKKAVSKIGSDASTTFSRANSLSDGRLTAYVKIQKNDESALRNAGFEFGAYIASLIDNKLSPILVNPAYPWTKASAKFVDAQDVLDGPENVSYAEAMAQHLVFSDAGKSGQAFWRCLPPAAYKAEGNTEKYIKRAKTELEASDVEESVKALLLKSGVSFSALEKFNLSVSLKFAQSPSGAWGFKVVTKPALNDLLAGVLK